MNNLLKFLIVNLRTLDGSKGTANAFLEKANKKSIKEYLKRTKRDHISESARLAIVAENEHKIFRKVYMKYLIMRVRAKISFTALMKRMTIIELFITTIHRSYL